MKKFVLILGFVFLLSVVSVSAVEISLNFSDSADFNVTKNMTLSGVVLSVTDYGNYWDTTPTRSSSSNELAGVCFKFKAETDFIERVQSVMQNSCGSGSSLSPTAYIRTGSCTGTQVTSCSAPSQTSPIPPMSSCNGSLTKGSWYYYSFPATQWGTNCGHLDVGDGNSRYTGEVAYVYNTTGPDSWDSLSGDQAPVSTFDQGKNYNFEMISKNFSTSSFSSGVLNLTYTGTATDVDFFVSNDGGVNWYNVTYNGTVSFNSSGNLYAVKIFADNNPSTSVTPFEVTGIIFNTILTSATGGGGGSSIVKDEIEGLPPILPFCESSQEVASHHLTQLAWHDVSGSRFVTWIISVGDLFVCVINSVLGGSSV